MTRSRFLITKLMWILIFTVASCNPKKRDVEIHQLSEALITIEVKALGINITIPKAAKVIHSDDGVTIIMDVKKRNVRQFEIRQLESQGKMRSYSSRISLVNKAVIDYVLYEQSGGSGGTEYQLDGILVLDQKEFFISATDQVEYQTGDPQFCFTYLATLVPISD